MDMTFKEKKYMKHQTRLGNANDNHFSFDLQPHIGSEGYLLQEALLELQVLMVAEDGSPIAETTTIGPSVANNIANSLFKQVKVSLNDVCTSESISELYMYKAYVKDLENYDDGCKRSQLEAQGNAMLVAKIIASAFKIIVEMCNF